MTEKDNWKIQCLLEDYDDYSDGLYAAADYCFEHKKDTHESEEFILAYKTAFVEVHGA